MVSDSSTMFTVFVISRYRQEKGIWMHTSTRASAQSTCTVRTPQLRDCKKMADLTGQLGYECTEEVVRARLGEMRDSSQCAVYVAELPGGQIAGWIEVYVFRSVATGSFAEISGLVVDQQVRSRGIGKILLEAAEEWARSLGFDDLSVRSNVKRARAHRFYRNNGYEQVKLKKHSVRVCEKASRELLHRGNLETRDRG